MKKDFLSKIGTEIKVGDCIEIILRSSIYCIDDEEPIYHSGILQEINYQNYKDERQPVEFLVKFNKDSLYDEDEEEWVYLSEIEDVFVKKYTVLGYGMLNEGVTLSVKGNGIGNIIWFKYDNGNLIPEFISEGSISHRKRISIKDMELINEIKRYGAAQKFMHYVLSKSGQTEPVNNVTNIKYKQMDKDPEIKKVTNDMEKFFFGEKGIGLSDYLGLTPGKLQKSLDESWNIELNQLVKLHTEHIFWESRKRSAMMMETYIASNKQPNWAMDDLEDKLKEFLKAAEIEVIKELVNEKL